MKLHAIELKNVRGIEHLVMDDLPDTGVIVVAGDNEMGKSTIAEAIQVALTWPAKANRKETKALYPNDRDAHPEITLDMTLGSTRFTLRKVFAGSKSSITATEIRIAEPSPMSLTGDEAQQWLDALTSGEGTRELWNAFVARQGAEQAALKLGAFAHVTEALQEATGGSVESAEQRLIVEAARDERGTYYTQGGRPKEALKAAAESVVQADARYAAAVERVNEVRGLIDQVDRNDRRRFEVESELPDAEAAVVAWRARVAELAEYRHAKATADDAVRLADSEARNAREAMAVRAELVEQERVSAAALAAVSETLGPLREASEEETRHVEAVEAAVEAARRRRDIARRLLHIAEQDSTHCHNVAKLADVDDVLGRVGDLDEDAREKRRLLRSHRITDDDAKRAAGAEHEWRMATTVLEASSSELGLSAASASTVIVDGENIEVGSASWTRPIVAPTTVRIGAVTVTVSPGDGAGEYAGREVLAKQKLNDILTELGVTSVQAAEEKAKARAEAAAALDIAVAKLDAELRDRDLNQLRAMRDDLHADVRAYPVQRADMLAGWSGHSAAPLAAGASPMPAVPIAADVPAIAEDEDAARAALERAREADRSAGADFEAAMGAATAMNERPARHALHATLAEEQARLDDVRRATDALDAARERETDDALAKRGVAAADAVEAATAAAAEAAEALVVRGADDAEESLAGAEGHLEALREEQVRLKVRRGHLDGELTSVTGVNEELAEASARRTRLRREAESVNRRAAAAQLLYETLESARADTRRTIGEPLLNKLGQYGGAVFGHSTTFELDEDMAVKSRSNVTGTFEYDALSGGAQEQIDVLLRLAVAGVMDGEAGAPVIIDDALGYSDPGRLRKMNNAFARAGEDSQILVLTCYPERFSRIKGSHRLDMDDLLRPNGGR